MATADSTATPPPDYAKFLDTKTQLGGDHGFEPLWLPDAMMPFQRHLSEWEIRKGRGATFAGCGLGKSLLALTRCENVVRHTGGRALIATPLAVAPQFVTEGEKFGVGVTHSRDGKVKGPGTYVTNYERLHLFDPADFVLFVGDESGGLKDYSAERSGATVEFCRRLPYRGLYSGMPAPNDYDELGTSAEALGELGYQDMITRFFTKKVTKDYLGWGRAKYRLREYAERDYWRWVCSWARACRKPSDLGFEDGPFVLPPLEVREHLVSARTVPAGHLFDPGAETLHEQREVRRRTIRERCEKVAEIVGPLTEPVVAWCHLNPEGDLLTKLIPGAVQVSGADSDDAKEEKLVAFAKGQIARLVTKPVVCAWGLNWQHCARQVHFPSHSFEQWHQCIHRSLRFGQTRRVIADVVTTDGDERVRENLERKRAQAAELFDRLAELMNAGLRVGRTPYGDTQPEVPSWLR